MLEDVREGHRQHQQDEHRPDQVPQLTPAKPGERQGRRRLQEPLHSLYVTGYTHLTAECGEERIELDDERPCSAGTEGFFAARWLSLPRRHLNWTSVVDCTSSVTSDIDRWLSGRESAAQLQTMENARRMRVLKIRD
eukprot:scaffold581_cov263-Pinguiococcus_pyrenoidosus.AAC.15